MFKKKYEPIPYEIRKQMREWKQEEGLNFDILCRYRKGILEIITTKPGIIIGFQGSTINNLKNRLKDIEGYRKCKITYIRYYV